MSIMNGAKILVETLIEQGTEVVFGYPGGQVLNIYDELYKASDRIKHILTAHEQGAAHAGDGYARTTGRVGVVIATSGPGATNLVTGIANAYLDSVPTVFITGNVPCSLIGRDSFQEVDITGVTMPIVKHNYLIKDVNDLADTIREAFKIAKSGRPGPVLIDIPKDVQVASCEYTPALPEKGIKVEKFTEDQLDRAAEMIAASKKPYIYCGGGVVNSDAENELKELSEKLDAPVGTSMMGLSAIPDSCKNKLGMVGMHGIYTATVAKTKADLVIAVGVRFSDRATGDKNVYLKDANIIHIDTDAAELDKNITSDLGIVGDAKSVLAKLLPKLGEKNNPEWWAEIEEIREYEKANKDPQVTGFTPYNIIDAVNSYTTPDMPIATDVGQHQMWVAQRYRFEKARTFVTSGGLGTMGYGMGAAIGSAVGTGKRTVLFTGDGSFGMNLNEMATAVSQKLPLVIIVMNNGVLGMVRQWQTLFYGQRYAETNLERRTDFVALAKAFGADGYRATDMESLKTALDVAFSTDGPVLIDCMIDGDERVLPMIPAGKSVSDIVIK